MWEIQVVQGDRVVEVFSSADPNALEVWEALAKVSPVQEGQEALKECRKQVS